MSRRLDCNRDRLYAAVGARLQWLRLEAKLTLAVLSEKTGISRGQLAKIEEGGCACPLHVLVTLADVYDVTLDEMVPVLAEVA